MNRLPAGLVLRPRSTVVLFALLGLACGTTTVYQRPLSQRDLTRINDAITSQAVVITVQSASKPDTKNTMGPLSLTLRASETTGLLLPDRRPVVLSSGRIERLQWASPRPSTARIKMTLAFGALGFGVGAALGAVAGSSLEPGSTGWLLAYGAFWGVIGAVLGGRAGYLTDYSHEIRLQPPP